MKWLFIVAVLLNILYYSYYSFFLKSTDDSKPAVVQKTDKSQLLLLRELDANQLKVLQSKVVASSADINPESTENNTNKEMLSADLNAVQCFVIGPGKKSIMDEIRLALEKDYPNQVSFRIETTSATTYYRIYIPPVNDKEKRTQTLELLDKKGLKDHYVMSIDGRKNAIALGVFKKHSAAETIAKKASKIGLSTTIEAITDDKNSLYTLKLRFLQDIDLTAFEKLLAGKQIKSSTCEK
jgi:hypothetical protein